MSSSVIVVAAIIFFIAGYHFYSRYLKKKIFDLDEHIKNGVTPAQKINDGIDYVPTDRSVLLGHHFSSIAGAAPIVGPAIAIIWGWVPALLWIVLGVIFLGAVHDFGALVTSMRYEAKSIGEVASKVIGPRTQKLFLIIIFFLIWMVIAVFALVIGNLFIQFPSSVIPVNFEIIIAVLMGLFINKNKYSLTLPSIMAQVGLLIMIYIGTLYPVSLSTYFGENDLVVWIIFLMIYSFIASSLPVWILLQPRDYINSHQLSLGLILMIGGVFITNPQIVAPALNLNPQGAPPWFPFLFITIACGAISGFHGLVSSGTTSKQVKQWRDARRIGYGAMLGEGMLALLATLAVSTGFKSSSAWHAHYSSWEAASGLTAKINAFVLGAGNFVSGFGIPQDISNTVIAVLIISFAATSLDTACRIQRHIVSEIGEQMKIPFLKNRFLGSFIAVGSSMILMFSKSGGKGGLFLWPLFGATNQMLAGLTLVVISVYLIKNKKPSKSFVLPAIFVIAMTSLSLIMNIERYFSSHKTMLGVIASILFICQIFIIVEASRILKVKSL